MAISSNNTSVNIAEINKIDSASTSGLAGTSNSLAYRVHEIERHFHSRERWFGKLAVQTATDWADDTLTPFRAISGNNAYGADANDEAQVLGTADTPVIVGSVKFDPHRLILTATNSGTPWKLQLVYGTGTMADAITAGQYTEICVVAVDPAGPVISDQITELKCPRLAAGTKVWVRAWNATNNATIDFLIGLHEYEG